MSSATSPYLGITWDRESNDFAPPSDHNNIVRYLDNSIARVLLNLLFENGLINRDPDVCLVDETTGRIQVPPSGDPIVGLIRGRCFWMGSDRELSGTATGGGTTYLVSPNLTEEDDFWRDAFVIFTSGSNSGSVVQVTAYDRSSTTLTWDTVLSTEVQSGDTFVVTFYYIQDLTNGVENWVYGRATGRTTTDGLIQWVATTSSTPVAGDIMVAKVTLDAGGNVVAVDNAPDGHHRNLWTGAGAVHCIEFSGSLATLYAGAWVDVEIEHDDLILLGPISDLTVDPDGCTVTPTEYCYGDRFTLRIENKTSYPAAVSYSGKRWGRKRVLL